MKQIGFSALILPIVLLLRPCDAQSPLAHSNAYIIDAISNTLTEIDACSYHARMNSKFFGSDSIEVRDFSIHVRRNPDNTLYGYDWEISEHKEAYTFTFMILPSSWYRIHSGTQVMAYQSLLEPFEPGSFFWNMRDYLILDEVLAPFKVISPDELAVVDSADCYKITRQMNDLATRELVVQKNSWQILRSTSRIIEKALGMEQMISVDFLFPDEMALADTAFAPEYYVAKGYQLNIAEYDVAPVEAMPLPEVNYEDVLLDYPLIGEGDDTTRLLDFKGEYLLLDFWYASCRPCLKALPVIQELAGQYPELRLLAVNCHDMGIRKNLTAKFREKAIEMPLLFGSRDLVIDLGISSFPTYLLITPDQKVRHISGGVEGVKRALAEVFGR